MVKRLAVVFAVTLSVSMAVPALAVHADAVFGNEFFSMNQENATPLIDDGWSSSVKFVVNSPNGYVISQAEPEAVSSHSRTVKYSG